MKKFWNKSLRQTRSRTRKQREQALLDQAMTSQSPQQQQAGEKTEAATKTQNKTLFIFLNDFTDSDNAAAAIVWAKWLLRHPDVDGMYIAEPRPVNLGYYMSGKDFERCIGLVKTLVSDLISPKDKAPFLVLGGRMTEAIISSAKVQERDEKGNTKGSQRELRPDEVELLRRCIAVADGRKKDTLVHAQLMALDYLTMIHTSGNRNFDTFIDAACVKEDGPDSSAEISLQSHLESPINLKTHYHEELVFRTAAELEEFQNITKSSSDTGNLTGDGLERLKDWYQKAVSRKLKDFGDKNPVEWLTEYGPLFAKMKKYDRIIFFGGCSLTILHHVLLYEPDLAAKIEYYQQGGTSDPGLNILGNPLNFALNYKAARYIFTENNNFSKFRRFTLIPTDTTKKIEFAMHGLNKWSPAIGVHSLAFVGRADPWDLIRPEERGRQDPTAEELIAWRAESVNDDKYRWWPSRPDDETYVAPHKASKAVMADLLAFLVSFTSAFDEIPIPDGTVKRYVKGVGIRLDEPPKGSARKEQAIILDLDKDQEGPFMDALMLDVPAFPKVPVVTDTLKMVEKAIETADTIPPSTLPDDARDCYSACF